MFSFSWWVGSVGSSTKTDGHEKVCNLIDQSVTKLNQFGMIPDPLKLAEFQNRLIRVKQMHDPRNVFCHNPCNIVVDNKEQLGLV